MTKIAIYPGSFDPITYGHIDLIKRAAKIFKKVVVAVADNSSKDSLFTVKERVALIEQVTADLGNIEVDSFKRPFNRLCPKQRLLCYYPRRQDDIRFRI